MHVNKVSEHKNHHNKIICMQYTAVKMVYSSNFSLLICTFIFFSGWHHRLNSKAGMSGLGFYRLVPLLKREAALMELALRGGDLQRDNRGMYRRLETQLWENWAKYLEHEISTTAFLKACGSLYGVRLSTPTIPTESD